MDADVAVFDPETIREVGTYGDPNHPAVGAQPPLVPEIAVVAGGEMVRMPCWPTSEAMLFLLQGC